MENTESLIANFSPFLEFQGGLFARFQVHNSVCRKLSTAIDVCRNFLEPLWLEHPLIGLNRHRPSSAEPNAEDVVCFARALGLVRRARDRACRVRGRESNAASRRPDRRGGSRPATTTSVAAEARHRRPFRMRRRDPASKYLIEDRIPGPLSLRCAIGPVGGRHSRGSRATAEPAGRRVGRPFYPALRCRQSVDWRKSNSGLAVYRCQDAGRFSRHARNIHSRRSIDRWCRACHPTN